MNNYYKIKNKIEELSGIPVSSIILDIEPVVVIAKGINMGKMGWIYKNLDKMCIVELEDKSLIKILKTSIMSYIQDPIKDI